MQFVLCNLDVRKCHLCTLGLACISDVLFCLLLCLLGHACGQAVTGNSLCAGVMEVAAWNDLMK